MHSDFHRRCRTGGRIGLRREYRIVAMSQPLCVFCRRHPIEQLWRPFCSERCKLQDLACMHTANCRSAITYIDGDKGILLYRGYPIEQLAEESDYLETAYLILFGELPTAQQQQAWAREITNHTMLHENIKKLMEGFQYDAHPMAIFLSIVGAMSGFYPDAKDIFNKQSRLKQTHRAIAKVPSIAAWAYRHSIGRPYVYPDNDVSFTGNFRNMLFKL